jgi:hypothetical protein
MEAAPTAALPIIVSTTRRDRFMMWPFNFQRRSVPIRPGKGGDFTASRLRREHLGTKIHPPPKPKACANEPKPPRVTPPEDSEAAADVLLDESPLKKLQRDERL